MNTDRQQEVETLGAVLVAYGIATPVISEPVGQGLINMTWKIADGESLYILQQINTKVFSRPEYIAHNLKAIGDFLAKNHPDYFLPLPLFSKNGKQLWQSREGAYYRIFPFVKGSHSYTTVQSADQAYEAARQFGKFSSVLSGMDTARLKATLPGFHDLEKRYEQFRAATSRGDLQRRKQAAAMIRALESRSGLVNTYRRIKQDSAFRLRVTHHDTKISNVLFDAAGKGICVIDLDTVMPGYFISDLGDMLRTYLSPVSEEEDDYSTIEIRESFYQAVVGGYLDALGDELTPAEQKHLVYAGYFMTYMQTLRFLTDYLEDDHYYGARYPEHNFVRAGNQLHLLEKLEEFSKKFFA